MSPEKQDHDRLAYCVGSLTLSGLTMTKVILWLIAITIVSFTVGFGILALSGDFPPGPEQEASPFRNTALDSSNATFFMPDNASSGEVRILLGAGDLTLGGGAEEGRLMEARVAFRRPELQPDYAESQNGSVKTVAMTETGRRKDWLFAHSFDSRPNTWDVRLSENVPVALTVNVGAGESVLTLGRTNLTTLAVNNGAGDTTIDLTGYHGGQYDASVHSGVGELTVRIDKRSNTRIVIHNGIGEIDASGIVQTDDHYITAGFNPSLPVNEISITQGVGSIQLEAV